MVQKSTNFLIHGYLFNRFYKLDKMKTLNYITQKDLNQKSHPHPNLWKTEIAKQRQVLMTVFGMMENILTRLICNIFGHIEYIQKLFALIWKTTKLHTPSSDFDRKTTKLFHF